METLIDQFLTPDLGLMSEGFIMVENLELDGEDLKSMEEPGPNRTVGGHNVVERERASSWAVSVHRFTLERSAVSRDAWTGSAVQLTNGGKRVTWGQEAAQKAPETGLSGELEELPSVHAQQELEQCERMCERECHVYAVSMVGCASNVDCESSDVVVIVVASAVDGSLYTRDGLFRCFNARCIPVNTVCFGSYDMIVDDGGWRRQWMTKPSTCLSMPHLIPACWCQNSVVHAVVYAFCRHDCAEPLMHVVLACNSSDLHGLGWSSLAYADSRYLGTRCWGEGHLGPLHEPGGRLLRFAHSYFRLLPVEHPTVAAPYVCFVRTAGTTGERREDGDSLFESHK